MIAATRNPAHADRLRIDAMLVGYYALCPRKAWLSLRGLWMEQESDQVAVGRLPEERSYWRARLNTK